VIASFFDYAPARENNYTNVDNYDEPMKNTESTHDFPPQKFIGKTLKNNLASFALRAAMSESLRLSLPEKTTLTAQLRLIPV
jgi:hypothetical protein